MSTTLERLRFLRYCSYEAREALITYVVSGLTDDEWGDAVDFSVNIARDTARARARELAELEASQHVSDRGQQGRAGEVESVERQVDVP